MNAHISKREDLDGLLVIGYDEEKDGKEAALVVSTLDGQHMKCLKVLNGDDAKTMYYLLTCEEHPDE